MFEQNSLDSKFNFIESQIKLLKSSFQADISQKIVVANNELNFLKTSFSNKIEQRHSQMQNQVIMLKNSYEQNDPKRKDKKGFVQITKNNKVISLEDLKKSDKISLQTPAYIASCTIDEIQKQ